jgi:hypothetical protein
VPSVDDVGGTAKTVFFIIFHSWKGDVSLDASQGAQFTLNLARGSSVPFVIAIR